ncbi:MAG: NAD(P)-dependent alcohol dehydrogenase [Promethearchaeota archaeon]|nr:MAG: NAD(P)-dependent alcohol dehydrogenase [Candidatus Lokiarchaeota archaeon]
MKAILWTKYGPPEVLQLREIEKPTPNDNEVLIKIHATTVTSGDCEMRGMKVAMLYRLLMRLYIGLIKPKRIRILGMELAGEIEKKGEKVTEYKEGDQIFAATAFNNIGTYAEYICLPSESKEGLLARKPVNMSYEEAAAVPVGGIEALNYLGNGRVQSGQKILINGAGGTIGTFAIQLGKFFGAEVTGVDKTEKLEMLLSIGADHVIDYTQEDFVKNSENFDVVLDLVGKRSLSKLKKSLKKDGLLLLANPKLSHNIQSKFSKRIKAGTSTPKNDDLLFLKELIEAGKLKSVIDRTFLLEETVEAHRYVETGQKKGHVVITVK